MAALGAEMLFPGHGPPILGDLAVACELAEFAWRADPEDDRTRSVRAAVYRARVEAETSLMAKGIYGAAVRDMELADSK